jgi:hypothetical protein
MSLDALLTVTKFLGIAFAGLFSMLPLVVDYRDKHKKINKWGRIALIGAAISTFVSAASQYFELQKDKSDAQDALSRTNTLLAQVKRVLNPVRDLNLGACVEVPLGSPDMAEASTRLKQYAAGDLTVPSGDIFNQAGHSLLIRSTSSIIQNLPPNVEVYRALSDVTIEVSFIVSPATLNDIAQQFFDSTAAWKADLRIGFISSTDQTKNQFFYKDGRLYILIQNVESNPKYWISSGKIISIEDLQNAVLIARLENFSVSGDFAKIGNIRSTFALRKLSLNMTDGRHFEIKNSALLSSQDKQKEPLYLYRFPSDEEQFPVPAMIGLTCDELIGGS